MEILKAEADENVCRKGFAPTEAVAMGDKLEALEGPKAKERRAQAKGKPRGAKNVCSVNLTTQTGRVTEVVGSAVGMSRSTYEAAKKVVEAANKNPELAGVVEEMDRTGNSALRSAPGAFSSSPSIKTAESALSITSPIVVKVPGDRPPKNTSRRSHLQEHGRSLI